MEKLVQKKRWVKKKQDRIKTPLKNAAKGYYLTIFPILDKIKFTPMCYCGRRKQVTPRNQKLLPFLKGRPEGLLDHHP